MSDSVKKWHEMQEELKDKKIYESPDGGDTVTERPFLGDISERVVIKKKEKDIKKQAYNILIEYDEEAIKKAYAILTYEV
jgi:hypothetical protein|tara:strand:- start:137 stop:376 length:240 start_codon:yes stop_codon:yes gene_type:complete